MNDKVNYVISKGFDKKRSEKHACDFVVYFFLSANIVLNELLDLGELVPQMKDYGELVFDEDQTDFTDIRESPEPKRVRSDFGTEDEAEMENEEELVQNQENRSNEISKPDVTKAKAQNFLERIQQFRCSQE